jgi:hypothetical protein
VLEVVRFLIVGASFATFPAFVGGGLNQVAAFGAVFSLWLQSDRIVEG